jgi:rhodanese-related sulfurtransferase
MTQQEAPAEPYGRLSPQEARDRVGAGELSIVDVREEWEYARDHILEATLTPLRKIIADPEKAITADDVVFVCEVGQRSAVAAELLPRSAKHVFNLEGGMQAWRNADRQRRADPRELPDERPGDCLGDQFGAVALSSANRPAPSRSHQA